ncbi:MULTISPECIES: DUF4359 domain-containing protein [unclassified Synechocystis]|uniref:DUF4359 domain-containing protein n=1 Tax=unclassified Synechocystis TaxID=2640012 RepID=UPI0003FE7BC6|nr:MULTISPECIES: DUF4359 domain-containing protein [unclassified Synechocystis]AIE74020.1 hypothetical protein D082_14920 [Synechocystis sp. PCC 6714]MCT0252674.1 DUF4359 domain-containing protein [Synechocystis sp. CS-94]
MRVLSVFGAIGGVMMLASGALMAIGNPGKPDYEHYAVETLSIYLKTEICPQAPADFGGFVQSYCKTLVDVGQPQIKQVIAQTTNQQNFLLFSIYQTTLALPDPLPTYEFQTIGIMKQFYTYQAMEI